MSWLLPWRWQPWNLTTGAQEWGRGVDTSHAGGREGGPEAQESYEEQRAGGRVPSMASVSPSVKRKEGWTSRSLSSSSPNWNLGEDGGGGSNESKASCPFDGWRPQRTGTCPRWHSKSMVATGLDCWGRDLSTLASLFLY